VSRISRALACLKEARSWIELSAEASFLRESGWLRSKASHRPEDERGNPIPWITYSSLSFLMRRVRPDMSVFEFGAGSSTLWWAGRVRQVVSCEHDRQWFEKIRSAIPANATITCADVKSGQYCRSILSYQNAFDVVVIDGRDRIQCAHNCLGALKSSGVVIWDNADRTEYEAGYQFLAAHGFRRIDFTGMGPINAYGWSTAIFYRTENCFDL
jgi:predicted O-methyltransferase YrrM